LLLRLIARSRHGEIGTAVHVPYGLRTTSAISSAVSSTVCVAVFRASLSANEALCSTASCLETLCHIGRSTCSPETARVTKSVEFVIGPAFTEERLREYDHAKPAIGQALVNIAP